MIAERITYKKTNLKAIRILIRHRVHIVACALAAVWGWARLAGTGLLIEDLIIVPLAMACIYQWNRVCDVREDLINNPQDACVAARSKKTIVAFCLVGAAACLGLGMMRGEKGATLWLVLVLVLGFLYSTPFLLRGGAKRLKDLLFVKNLNSSLGWSLITVVYPAAHARTAMGAGH